MSPEAYASRPGDKHGSDLYMNDGSQTVSEKEDDEGADDCEQSDDDDEVLDSEGSAEVLKQSKRSASQSASRIGPVSDLTPRTSRNNMKATTPERERFYSENKD